MESKFWSLFFMLIMFKNWVFQADVFTKAYGLVKKKIGLSIKGKKYRSTVIFEAFSGFFCYFTLKSD